ITIDVSKVPVWAGTGSFVIGLGMGLTSTTFIVAVQNHDDWETRSVASTSNMFMRMIGCSLVVALLDGGFNSKLSYFLGKESTELTQDLSTDSANTVLDSSVTSNMSDRAIALLEKGLAVALNSVFWGIFIFAVITLVLTIFLPQKESHSQ